MLVLGLTGASGSGKGYIAKLFARCGVPSLDCDAVFRELCTKGSPCLAEIAQALGDEVLTPEGEYDRRTAAGIVFRDSEKLHTLNRITHRHILSACREWLGECREKGLPFAIIDAPVLYESGFDAECDAVVAVVCDTEERIRRIVMRDGISEDRARERILKQKSADFYREHADYLIENNADTSKEELISAVDEILKSLKGRAAMYG